MFKKCTVASAKVAATLSSYPTYVDLARVGVTTLAEAQSIRVYADESKTTEWAREIVSATEMHVKIPSLTTTTTIYVDYDGVRSDYGVTDTYGRNAVWGDNYTGVYHMDSHTVLTDSTGANDGTPMSLVAGDVVAGALGNALSMLVNSKYAVIPQPALDSYTIQCIVRRDGVNSDGNRALIERATAVGNFTRLQIVRVLNGTGNINFQGRNGTVAQNFSISTSGASIADNNWNFVHNVATSGTQKTYIQGIERGSATITHGANTLETNFWVNRLYNADNLGWNAYYDEIRFSSVVRTANWITTEYNNQSDEATFWPTWEDAGGGGAVAKKGFLAWL